MLRVSGPVSVSIYELPDSKKLMLFGDIHESKKGMCKIPKPDGKSKREVVFITDFIDSLSSPKEVFLESNWVHPNEKHEKSLQEESDVIARVLNHYHDAMYSIAGRRKGIRVHYTDVRALSNISYILVLVLSIMYPFVDNFRFKLDKQPIEYIMDFFPTLQTFKKFMDIMIDSDDYKQDINILLKGNIAFTQSNVFASAPGQSVRKIHRIRKQMLKLSIQDRKVLMAYHRKKTQELHKEHGHTYNAVMKTLKQKRNVSDYEYKETFTVAFSIFDHIIHMMDIYALARMIYYIRNTKSKNIVFYAGATHTKNYARFFNDFWPKEAVLLYHQDINEKSPYYRCVSIPKKALE